MFFFLEKNIQKLEIYGREELLVLLFAEKTPNAPNPEQLLCLLFVEKTPKIGKTNYYVFFFVEKTEERMCVV